MTEFIVLSIVLPMIMTWVYMWFFRKRYTRPIVMQCDGWIDICIQPLPELITNCILTDGKEVEFTYLPRYDSTGACIMGWNSKKVTHWMPMPNPPKD